GEGGVGGEVPPRGARDGGAPQLHELFREATAESRAHTAGRDDDRQLRRLRLLRHGLPGQPSSAFRASPTVATPRMSSDTFVGSRTLLRGTIARRKPSAAASRSLSSSRATARTPPVTPTAPPTSTSGGTTRSM